MSDAPLMPKATAVWLVENTSLTFDQIAEFCKLHPLEVKGIADGEVATGIKGYDPISTGQLTARGNRRRREGSEPSPASFDREDAHARIQEAARRALHAAIASARPPERGVVVVAQPSPSSRTRRSCASSAQPSTRFLAIRERTHWNSANLQPMDPVTLGLCSQIDLDFEVNRAAKERPKVEEDRSQTLVSAEITTARPTAAPASQLEVFGVPTPKPKPVEERVDVNSVFGKLKEKTPQSE